MRALCSIWSAFCLCLLLSSQSASYCWLRQKWQSAVEKAKLGSWDKFLCSCKTEHKGGVDWLSLENGVGGTLCWTAALTSQSWYNCRRGWYSLDRSIRKSMSRSMQRGSESGSRLGIDDRLLSKILKFRQQTSVTNHKI